VTVGQSDAVWDDRGVWEGLHRYRFRKVWRVGAPPGEVFEALHDVETWPRWWREIREVDRLDDDRARTRIRSVLPYDLHLVLTRTRDDADALVLETAIEGDLVGFARFRLRPEDSGTRLLYEQEVEVTKPVMRWLAPLARPLFIANHEAMMRSGEAGLRRFVVRGR
jgi:uncharacterized membrane protein